MKESLKIILLIALSAVVMAACGEEERTQTPDNPGQESVEPIEPEPEPEPKPTTDCNELGINRQQRNTGVCEEDGQKIKVVNQDQLLRLPDVDVKLEGIETTDSLADSYGVASESADGTYAVMTLTVTNKLNTPQTFDEGQEQVGLTIDDAEFSQDFDAANGADEDSCLWQQDGPIQPSGSLTCTVIFDIPDKFIGKLEKSGNLLVVPFADVSSYSDKRSIIGVVRTYE